MARSIGFFFIGVVFASCATLLVSADKQLFSLNIAPPSGPLKAGAELRLLVTVTNTSDRTIGFISSLGLVPENSYLYEIEVLGPLGNSAPPSDYVRNLKNKPTADFRSEVAHWLKPGASFVDQVTVTRFYDLSEPGKYTIALAREIPPAQNLGKGKVRSNSITITVVR